MKEKEEENYYKYQKIVLDYVKKKICNFILNIIIRKTE